MTVRRILWLAFCSSVPLSWFFSITASRQTEGFPSSARLVFYCAMGGCMLVYAFARRHNPIAEPMSPRRIRASRALCCAPLALFPLSLCLPHFPTSWALACLAMLTCGTSLALTFLWWFEEICHQGDFSALRVVLLSFALSAATRLTIALIASAWVPASLWIVAALTVLSLASLSRITLRETPQQGRPLLDGENKSDWGRPPRRLSAVVAIIELIACSLILGGSRDLVSGSPQGDEALVVNYLLRSIVPLGIYAWVTMRHFGKSLRPIQYLLVVALFGLMALSLFGGPTVSETIAQALLLVAWDFTLIVVYVSALGEVFVHGMQPTVALGPPRATYELSIGAGMAIAHLATSGSPSPVPGNVILFLVGTVFLIMANRLVIVIEDGGVTFSRALGEQSRADGQSEPRFRQIAAEYGLTERERQVMTRIYGGVSKGEIATELGVSENTVRWHSKNLYEKLGVHSRRELVDLVRDAGKPAGEPRS
jgi:DNA-binding CsgD family transcriptional regulator